MARILLRRCLSQQRGQEKRIVLTRVRALALAAVAMFVLALAAPRTAQAASVFYNFNYTAMSLIGTLPDSGSISGTFEVDGTTIIGITGSTTVFGAITGLLAPNTFDFNDNVFSPTAPFLTRGGVSFSLASAPGQGNLYLGARGPYVFATDGTASEGTLTVTPVASAVPEPASLAILGLGLVGLAALRRQWRRSAAA